MSVFLTHRDIIIWHGNRKRSAPSHKERQETPIPAIGVKAAKVSKVREL
jgi:hypothetical protein